VAEVYVDQRLNVHLAASPGMPDGGVVVLEPGVNEVPDDIAKTPFMARLVESSAEGVKQAKTAQAAAKAQEESAGKVLAGLQEQEKANLEAKMKASEEWSSRRQAAMDKGVAFQEPHPDPATAHGIALTSPPAVYAAAGFIRKDATGQDGVPPVGPRVTPDTEHTAPSGGSGSRSRS